MIEGKKAYLGINYSERDPTVKVSECISHENPLGCALIAEGRFFTDSELAARDKELKKDALANFPGVYSSVCPQCTVETLYVGKQIPGRLCDKCLAAANVEAGAVAMLERSDWTIATKTQEPEFAEAGFIAVGSPLYLTQEFSHIQVMRRSKYVEDEGKEFPLPTTPTLAALIAQERSAERCEVLEEAAAESDRLAYGATRSTDNSVTRAIKGAAEAISLSIRAIAERQEGVE